MITPIAIPDRRLASPLGRVSPLAKLGVAVVWLAGLALTVRPWPPILLAIAALVAGLALGRIDVRALLRTLAPLWVVAVVVTMTNAAFGAANLHPASAEVARIGPLRLTIEALGTAASLGLRVVAIASVGAVFALTTDSTRLTDALVLQARVPARFAYGALAAYQAVPRFSQDLATLRQARRVRGLGVSWHPGLLFALLVLAIRHGDRMALAMDARGFGSGPRTHFRDSHWTRGDSALLAVGAVVLFLAFVIDAALR